MTEPERKQALAKIDQISKELDKIKSQLDWVAKIETLDKRLKKTETQLEKLSK